MKIIAVFAALLIATATNAQPKPVVTPPPTPSSSSSPSWFNCAGTKPTQMNVSGFSASPIPICANRPLQLAATGNMAVPIEQGARVLLTGRWATHVVYRDSVDLCQVLADAGTPCPTVADLSSLTINTRTKPNFPVQIPLNLTVEAVNADGQLIFCQAVNKVPTMNCDPPTTTTPRPIPTPVAGNWVKCDGPQILTPTSFSASPSAWCEGMNVCFNFAGTLSSAITSSLYLTLSTGFDKPTNLTNVFGSWSVDLRNQGFPYDIPAGSTSFKFCGPVNKYAPDAASAWRLGLMYLPDRASYHTDLLCLKSTNTFEIPPCP
ncbi:hypothetical protein DFQ26_002122 [Actinomortierella ambigua]|nr:hypothetical protein DFQ26_002122 [Actinomortierella ambigua]